MSSNYKTAMSREIRVAIVGMILGLLATIATEEMRCIFLPFTSKCVRCIIKQNIYTINPISLVFMPLIVGIMPLITWILFCIIDPENDMNPNLPLFTRIIILTFVLFILPLVIFIGWIYEFQKCW
jgi:hypothetical protein